MKKIDPVCALTLDFSRQCTGNLSVTKKRGSETRNEENKQNRNSEIERMGFWTRTKKSPDTPSSLRPPVVTVKSLEKPYFTGLFVNLESNFRLRNKVRGPPLESLRKSHFIGF